MCMIQGRTSEEGCRQTTTWTLRGLGRFLDSTSALTGLLIDTFRRHGYPDHLRGTTGPLRGQARIRKARDCRRRWKSRTGPTTDPRFRVYHRLWRWRETQQPRHQRNESGRLILRDIMDPGILWHSLQGRPSWTLLRLRTIMRATATATNHPAATQQSIRLPHVLMSDHHSQLVDTASSTTTIFRGTAMPAA